MTDKKYTLRQWRDIKGITQESAAKQIGVTAQTLSSWEKNETYPSIDKAYELATLYGVSIDSIFFDINHD